MEPRIFEICPQCKQEVNQSTNRMVNDGCGHRKCRICLVQEDMGCKACQEKKQDKPPNVSVIKFDGISKLKDVREGKKDGKDTLRSKDKTKKSNQKTKQATTISKPKKSLVIPSHILIISNSPHLYKCTICSKQFTSKTNIKYHSYCTGEDKPFKCLQCGKGFINQSHLNVHSRIHTGLRPFSCNICQKDFNQKSKLNRHMNLHTGQLPFVCNECGKKFRNKESLMGHSRLHTGEKPYSCKECDTHFSNKSNLNKHMATHGKDKLSMCEQCGKKFRGKWALAVHKKNHNLKKYFNCDICSKVFSKKQDLKRHKTIHADTKAFCCTICSTKFRRKDNLDRHVKNTHVDSEMKHGKKEKQKVNSKKNNSKISKNIEIKGNQDENKNNENFQEKPNAINVIKSSNKPEDKTEELSQNAVPVINGPFKLAFKTDSFKHNYNIQNRDYVGPHIKINKNYNQEESLNICKKILLPNLSNQLENGTPSEVPELAIEEELQEKNNAEPENKQDLENVILVTNKMPDNQINGDSPPMEYQQPVVDPELITCNTEILSNNLPNNESLCEDYQTATGLQENSQPTDKDDIPIPARKLPEKAKTFSFLPPRYTTFPHRYFPKIIMDTNLVDLSNEPAQLITTIGQVNEKDSLEICKKIFNPGDEPIHYETSFENTKHASIKNIKFKLPSTYTTKAWKKNNKTTKSAIPQQDKSTVNTTSKPSRSGINKFTQNLPTQVSPPESITVPQDFKMVIPNSHSSLKNYNTPLYETTPGRNRRNKNKITFSQESLDYAQKDSNNRRVSNDLRQDLTQRFPANFESYQYSQHLRPKLVDLRENLNHKSVKSTTINTKQYSDQNPHYNTISEHYSPNMDYQIQENSGYNPNANLNASQLERSTIPELSSNENIVHGRTDIASSDLLQMNYNHVNTINYDMKTGNVYAELQTVDQSNQNMFFQPDTEYHSVIVNPPTDYETDHLDKTNVPPFNEVHWRKRTSQVSNPNNL